MIWLIGTAALALTVLMLACIWVASDMRDQSPSKSMSESGSFFAEGFADGIKEHTEE